MTSRVVDSNGFVEIKRNPITMAGVFPYLGKQISATLEPDKIYHVYRPSEELASDDCINSFRLIPIVDEHAMIGDKGIPAEKKGVHGFLGESIVFDGKKLLSNIKIVSETLMNLINTGKRELSAAYACKWIPEKGVFEGLTYDFVQRNIRANHVALVDKGRCGSQVAVMDCAMDSAIISLESEQMADENVNTLEGLAQKINEILPALEKLREIEEKVAALSAAREEVKVEVDEGGTEEVVAEETVDEGVSKEELESAIKVAEDEAVKRTIADIAKRDSLVKRASKFIGTFACDSMSYAEASEYIAKKVGLEKAGVAAVEAYLCGREASVSGVAQDSKPVAADSDSVLGKFLSEVN